MTVMTSAHERQHNNSIKLVGDKQSYNVTYRAAIAAKKLQNACNLASGTFLKHYYVADVYWHYYN